MARATSTSLQCLCDGQLEHGRLGFVMPGLGGALATQYSLVVGSDQYFHRHIQH
jgi:hypothetical protein